MDWFNTQSSESTDFTLKTTITDTELQKTVTAEQQFHIYTIIGVTTNDNIVTKQHIVYLLHDAVTLFAKNLQNTSINPLHYSMIHKHVMQITSGSAKAKLWNFQSRFYRWDIP